MTKIDDETRLFHLLDAARRIQRMAQQETRESLHEDVPFLIRELEQIS